MFGKIQESLGVRFKSILSAASHLAMVVEVKEPVVSRFTELVLPLSFKKASDLPVELEIVITLNSLMRILSMYL